MICDPTTPQFQEQLEAVIDRASISYMLATMAQIAFAKSDHAASNWQDANLAKRWDKLGVALDALSDKNDM